jgi:hypothetical protein
MLARRLLFALALLMALTALAAGLAPRQTPQSESGRETATPAGEPAPDPVEATLDAQSEGQTVQARVGQIVRIVVNSSELDSVSLAEVGTKTAEPDSPARFELLAEVPGSYDIELLEAERRIGVLEIEG